MAELKKQVEEFFNNNPTVNKVYATADGNIFLEKSLNSAKNHARLANVELHEFTKSATVTVVPELTEAQIIEKVLELATAELAGMTAIELNAECAKLEIPVTGSEDEAQLRQLLLDYAKEKAGESYKQWQAAQVKTGGGKGAAKGKGVAKGNGKNEKPKPKGNGKAKK